MTPPRLPRDMAIRLAALNEAYSILTRRGDAPVPRLNELVDTAQYLINGEVPERKASGALRPVARQA